MTSSRYDKTIAAFDALNAEDPNTIVIAGNPIAKELLYAQRMTEMLEKFAPEASEALRLAVRSQHIQRWKIPRAEYPMTKTGYHQWRNALKQMHADIAGNVMRQQGYQDEMIARVQHLLRKEQLKADPETQTLEDVIVLSFLAYDLEAFTQKNQDYTEEKLVDILRKSYRKMSNRGQQAALNMIQIPASLLPIVLKAVQ